MSALDMLTGGLFQASGLSLVTEGLLVVQEVPEESGVEAGGLKVDIRLLWDGLEPDLRVVGGDLERERGLLSGVLLSLFLDRRATREELRAAGLPEDDPRGWWGNDYPEVEGDEYGSKLWLLERAKATTETLNRAREYARSALAWMLEDGIAERVDVDASYLFRGFLALGVEIVKPAEPAERFAFVWQLAA